MNERILLIEDEPGLTLTLSDRLRSEGYQVETAADGEEGFHAAVEGDFDLIVLDVMLPGRSGVDVCRDLRQQGIGTPVLMLTARDQLLDRVLGLKIGADDYVTKPFEMMELLARIEALLRRAAASPSVQPAVYQFGEVRVDLRSTEVWVRGQPVSVSAKEFLLLRYCIEHRGETLSRERILRDVWGYDSAPQTRTVDVHVAWLRQKLEDDPKTPAWIITVHGLGYRFTG
ncbi:MAG: response regulator transcription factor [Acidobacteria bacterium]|nr:response regulator transcription factor [Acidobacteriota bacterium]